MKFGADIQRMNPNDWADPLAFHVVRSAGHIFTSSNMLAEQIPVEVMTFPSASAALCV